MSKPRIGIIIGSTREGRFGDKPAQWIYEIAKRRGDIDVELVDLRDFPLPFFDEVASPLWVPSKDETAQNGLLDGLKIVAQNSATKDREERLAVGQAPVVFDTADSPACTDCGSIMVRNGSCYKCINCGATSGCS